MELIKLVCTELREKRTQNSHFWASNETFLIDFAALCNCDIYEVLASELLWPHDQS